jgi:YHS domain-containing protein
MRTIFSIVLLAGLLSVGSLSAAPATQPAAVPINKICPITGEPIDPSITLEYQGQTIGFCCRRCTAQFEEDPAKYMQNLK